MIDIKAPGVVLGRHPILFAAGSIEMGVAEMWQERLFRELAARCCNGRGFHVEGCAGDRKGTFLNPRRDDWDSTWVQSDSHAQFREQVEWELRGLEAADIVPMYFAPETKAPITLLEFGYMARRSKLIVCCPRAFYRRGNVEVVARMSGVPLFDAWAPWVDAIDREMARYGR